MTTLSLPVPVEDRNSGASRLSELVVNVSNTVLEKYWSPEHLEGIQSHRSELAKYFGDVEPFEGIEKYLHSRIRRCILDRVGRVLQSQAERKAAFEAIQTELPNHKIRRVHRRILKETLWSGEAYLKAGDIDGLLDHLNAFYDVHGRYPQKYFEFQNCPEISKGVLPYANDDGQLLEYKWNGSEMVVELRVPDTLEPQSFHDWSWQTHTIQGYEALEQLLDAGDMRSPSFEPTETKTGEKRFKLSFPVDVETEQCSSEPESVLAIDAGLRKDATCVVVDEDGQQISTPHFVQFNDRDGMQRLHQERAELNDKLASLRRGGKGHTDAFQRVKAEHHRVNNKIENKRGHLQHDVANQVIALALAYDVDAIVHEDLRSLTPPRGEGELSWELSSWSRRKIIEKIEYRAELAGLHVERVFPQNTSRRCSRCGATGYTTKSPDHTQEVWWGGHFRCDNSRCGFQGDRDYVGALNVARVFFAESEDWSDFSVSYIGTSEIVPAACSVGMRPLLHTSVAREQDVTAGGGSAYTAPAVTPTRTKSNSRATKCGGSGPATQAVLADYTG